MGNRNLRANDSDDRQSFRKPLLSLSTMELFVFDQDIFTAICGIGGEKREGVARVIRKRYHKGKFL